MNRGLDRSQPRHRGGLAVVALFATALCSLLVPACKPSSSSSKHAGKSPAKVELLPQETELARITLTAQAEQRLGITLVDVVREPVQRRRTFGGEVMIPEGKSTIVAAPVAGSIAPPEGGSIPIPGQRLDVETPVLTLAPLLTPERYVPTPAERVQMANARATLLSALTVASGDVQRTEAEVEAAKIALNRAELLLSDKVGSARAVDDARAQLNIAQSTLEASQQREQQLKQLLKELDVTGPQVQAAELAVKSPQSGVLRSLAVSRGQTVSAGATLFEVVDTSSMWIRVPLYVDLVSQVDLQADALLVPLGQRLSGEAIASAPDQARTAIKAHPVVAPPSADPLSATADVYYEVDNPGVRVRPGQRVGVLLELHGAEDGLVVPAKAILYDIYGGTWVYVKTGDHAFERRRVLIRYTSDSRAVLDDGPQVGAQVVADGAAELYGTEFGAGK